MPIRARHLVLLAVVSSLCLASACPEDGDGGPSDAGGYDGGGNDGGGSLDGGGDDGGGNDGGGYDGGSLDGGGDGGGYPDGGPDTIFTVEPTSLDFEHIITTTQCPQFIGEPILSNQIDVPLTCTATAQGPGALVITLEPANGVLEMQANGGTSYGVFFNCQDTSPVDVSLEIECADATGDLVDIVPVAIHGNIHYPE